MARLVLGIDVGTSGCKILALDEYGKICATAIEEYPLYTPKAGWTEQDPEDWWQAVVRGVKKVLAKCEGEVISVGFSGQMHGMVALDENNNVVRKAILWNDQRTVAECDEITELAGGLEGLLSYTNNRMLTGFTGGKILWMKKNEPENYAKTKLIINPKDYIRYRLAGTLETDVSDASGFGLFDVKNKVWAYELIEKIGLEKSLFPKVIESQDVVGNITAEASALTGLPTSCIVCAGGGDAVISTTGLGLIGAGRIGITLGTSGVVAMSLPAYTPNPDGALQISCNNAPNTWHAMGVTLAAAGSYQWFKNTFGDYECVVAEEMGKSPFALLDGLAKDTPAGADGLIFLPYLTGERAPINDPNARGAFLGIDSTKKKGHFARAVMEGVAYSLKQVYDLILSVSEGISTDSVVLAGGGAYAPIWRQIFADVFNLPVHTVFGSAEGGSFGAALVAGVAGGIWDSVASTVAIIKPESETLPNPENIEVYKKQYEKYCKFYDAIKWSFND